MNLWKTLSPDCRGKFARAGSSMLMGGLWSKVARITVARGSKRGGSS